MENLYRKFADKVDTKQNIKLLERQIKNLFDIVMNQEKSEGNGKDADMDEATLAKKPLGGFSCVNCEKKLVNLSGQRTEYTNWGKLPFRDPSERITRIG